MTNKTQNNFRDPRSGRRISAMEAMKRFQQRKSDTFLSSGRYDRVKVGLFALLQIDFIYSSWYMEDYSSILKNIVWPKCVNDELEKELREPNSGEVNQGSIAENREKEGLPEFHFINPSLVRVVGDANIVCLDPCPFLEDCMQYHAELVEKGRQSTFHKEVHDQIGVANCKKSAALKGQCKLAFKDKFSEELVMKYADSVGTTNKHGEQY